MKLQIVLALCVFAALAVFVLADVGGSADDLIRVDVRDVSPPALAFC